MKKIIELKDRYQFLINKGYSTKQIASEMKMSWSTVKGHLRKLGWETIHKNKSYNIPKEQLEDLIKQNYSTYKIADFFNCSQCVIINRLKFYNLKTHPKWNIKRIQIKKEISEGFKTCPQCNLKKPLTSDNFYIQKSGKFHYWCKNCNDQIALKKQTERKQFCVDYKGGKCSICGYHKYIGSLDFHHIDPSKKEFNISKLRTYSLEKLKIELNKCICVCRNCHGEIHGGVIGGPSGN